MHKHKAMLLSACISAALSVTAANATTAGNYGAPQIKAATHSDSLSSLRNAIVHPENFLKSHGHPVRPLPMPAAGSQNDGAMQRFVKTAVPAGPVLGTTVLGLGNGFTGPNGTFTVNSAPPDTDGAVGDTQFMQIVNSGIAVFSKTTKAVVYGPVPTNTLWAGFGGNCETDNDGDGTVAYDKAAGRWVVSQFALSDSTHFQQCVAVSKTSDATGGYWRYSFDYGGDFPDYPKLGVWPDAYYTTFNIFNSQPDEGGGGGRPTASIQASTALAFNGSRVCAYDRAKMLTGAAATQQCFQLSTSFGGVLPADVDSVAAPPVGSPNYMLNFGTNSLNLFKFHVDWTTPANTTLTGPISIPVAAFDPGCRGGTFCIAQPNTAQKLDSLADRLMYRLAYRNFGSYESLLVAHTVKANPQPFHPQTGVRWYEIRNPSGTPLVYQQSTYSPDSINSRWMGSIAMDKQGNIGLGYSISSSTVFPGIRYTGRLATDPLNTLQAEAIITNGGGSQIGLKRWGDYSGMSIDPVDQCTFWFTTEYLQTTGSFNWSTRIASFKFPSCL